MPVDGRVMPSWMEIRLSGNRTLVGRFVGPSGSARPVSEVVVKGKSFSFVIPPQWDPGEGDMELKGEQVNDQLKGTIKSPSGKTYSWTAVRAPKLEYVENYTWGTPVKLFNGKDLTGWKPDGKSLWIVENGILKNPRKSANLISETTFENFRLHIEFRYPKGSNSGIYLRGRYEVQIEDGYGKEPSDILFGGVYGFLPPNQMAANPPGEWQSYDIILNGRRVTVIANGKPIILDQVIPGITGGALDSKEANPGPIMIQGDHGPIEFRAFELTPLIAN